MGEQFIQSASYFHQPKYINTTQSIKTKKMIIILDLNFIVDLASALLCDSPLPVVVR